MPRRVLSTEELEVLDIALQSLETELPIHRHTDPDGPNEWHLPSWTIPNSLQALGLVDITDSLTIDHIRYRRPKISENEATVTLEMPDQTRYFQLNHHPLRGWCVI